MNSTPAIDMFSGTGQLAVAVTRAIHESTSLVSFSDNYGPARKYLRHRFPETQVASDFRDQIVPEGSIVTIGAPCRDLSIAGRRAGAERGSGTRSSLIHADPYDLEITHIRPDTTTQGETEYVLSTTHYCFVWPVESTIHVRADNYLQLKKRN